MAKPFNEWTVLPHGKLERLEDNIYSVTGLLHMPPMGEVQRRMTVVRLADHRLVVWSAIALDDAEMEILEGFGRFAYLVVPSDIHRMDAKIWKDRYPDMMVIAPPGARPRVEEVVQVDTTSIQFDDPNVHYIIVPGTAEREASLLVDSPSGATLVINDVIFNLANRPGLAGWIFEKIGMTGDEPHLPPLVRLRQVKDKDALRRQLERWARMPNIKRILVAHGDIIANDAKGVLGKIARDLAA